MEPCFKYSMYLLETLFLFTGRSLVGHYGNPVLRPGHVPLHARQSLAGHAGKISNSLSCHLSIYLYIYINVYIYIYRHMSIFTFLGLKYIPLRLYELFLSLLSSKYIVMFISHSFCISFIFLRHSHLYLNFFTQQPFKYPHDLSISIIYIPLYTVCHFL